MTNRYDLYATWATDAGRRKLAALGRRERCERMARHLAARGLPAEVLRVGRVTVLEQRRPEGADDQFEYLRAA